MLLHYTLMLLHYTVTYYIIRNSVKWKEKKKSIYFVLVLNNAFTVQVGHIYLNFLSKFLKGSQIHHTV